MFFGVCKFLSRFISNFSQVAAPLTTLTLTRFIWSESAQNAFDHLKKLFISAPILIIPDPKRQFIVEVDTSQCSLIYGKVHLCTFFFHRLSPTERNYDIEKLVKRALTQVTVPQRCPEGQLFTPESVHPAVLHLGHSSKLDFTTRLPSSTGNTVILTVVDCISKAAHFVPLLKLPSTKETVRVVFDHVFKIHGLPSHVFSDRGPQFDSQFWREICQQMGASVRLLSVFHPQTNGQAECTNQILCGMLRILVSHNSSSWSEQLPWAEYTHNSLPSSSTGLSPFHCCLGYQPPLLRKQRCPFPQYKLLFSDANAPGEG